MTVKAMEWAFKVQVEEVSDRLVLLCLANHLNGKSKQCNPGVSLICKETGVGRATVFRSLQRLKKGNLIGIDEVRTHSGRRTSSQYTLHLHRLGKSKSHHETGIVLTVIPSPSHHETVFHESESESESESSEAATVVSANDSESEAFEDEDLDMGKDALSILQDVMQEGLTGEAAILKAKLKGEPTTLRLVQLWKDLHVVFKHKVFLAPVSSKERGQFSQLRKLLGGESDVCLVMNAVLKDWLGFGKFLKEQGVVQDFPDHPHVGFLLKHGLLADQFRVKAVVMAVTEPLVGGLKPYEPDA